MAQPEVIPTPPMTLDDAVTAVIHDAVKFANRVAEDGPAVTEETVLLAMLVVRIDMLAAGVSALGSGGLMGMLGGILGGGR